MSASPPNLSGAQREAELIELLGHVSNSWDDERRTLARQLHDSLGSSLTALTMHLGLLTQKMPADPALLDRTAQMKRLLHNIIDNNRQLQHRLWNDKLEFLGVRVALSELATQFAEQHQVTVRCSLPDDELVCPRSHGVVLLRTLEEGLRNIAAHAHANEVDVIVDDNDDEVMLTVKDNGVGLNGASPDGAAAGHFGLRTVRERARHLGGRLTLDGNGNGNAGRGATLTLVLPKSVPAAATASAASAA